MSHSREEKISIADHAPYESFQSVAIPDDYLCPILQELMEDPVVAADGMSYERSAITEWFRRGKLTSPTHGGKLDHRNFIPNIILKKVIHEFTNKLPHIQREQQVKVDLALAIQTREKFIEDLQDKNEQLRATLEAESKQMQLMDRGWSQQYEQLNMELQVERKKNLELEVRLEQLSQQMSKIAAIQLEPIQKQMQNFYLQPLEDKAEVPKTKPTQPSLFVPPLPAYSLSFFAPSEEKKPEPSKEAMKLL